MEITGKVIKILQASTGNSQRGEWRRQDFIIETQEQYPKKVCLSNWNNKVDLENTAIGTVVKASINIESREYNEKWYTDVRVWKMEAAGAPQNTNNDFTPPVGDIPPPQDEPSEDGLPF